MELVEEFEREYSREEKNEVRWQEAGDVQQRVTQKVYGQIALWMGHKKYDRKYWKQMEKNQKQWRRNPFSRYNKKMFLKRIEKEKNEYKEGIIEEQNKKENKEDRQRIKEDRKYLEELEDENLDMDDLRDLYDEL